MKRYGKERKWWKKYIREQINPTYRVPVGQIEMSVAMLGEAGQNILRKKKTISKGCKDNEKTQRQLKNDTRKDMSIWGREADAVRDGKRAKRKQEIRTKHNFKMASKRFMYVCKIGDNKSVAYNTH